MSYFRKKIGKQGTWLSAFGLLFFPLFVLFSIRWLLYEPFVIPSASMVPNLLIHDHIIVEKFSYGIKSPLGDGWWFKFKKPKRGDIVVFRFPENRNVFFIKRLIGLPGDKIKIQNGQIVLNDKPWIIRGVGSGAFPDDNSYTYYIESIPSYELTKPDIKNEDNGDHSIRLYANQNHVDSVEREITVPQNSYFVMGDNRDESHDSRFWGFVPDDLLIGRASIIWLSCEKTIDTAPMICDPEKLRLNRVFKKVNEL